MYTITDQKINKIRNLKFLQKDNNNKKFKYSKNIYIKN